MSVRSIFAKLLFSHVLWGMVGAVIVLLVSWAIGFFIDSEMLKLAFSFLAVWAGLLLSSGSGDFTVDMIQEKSDSGFFKDASAEKIAGVMSALSLAILYILALIILPLAFGNLFAIHFTDILYHVINIIVAVLIFRVVYMHAKNYLN
jgi:hypothetical protein